ncbi:hypothetical protein ABFX02_10G006500 [Erythranthe guttata]
MAGSRERKKASIIADATRYIEELKERVEKLNQDVTTLQTASSSQQNSVLPPQVVKVETLEKGFLINVFSGKNSPSLLVSVLEAFEDLGLEVLDARVSCSDNFHLEAVSTQTEGQSDSIDAQVVKQAVLQAINNWSVHHKDEQD